MIPQNLLDPGETLYSIGLETTFNRILKSADGRFIIGGYASVSLEDGKGKVNVDMDGEDVDLNGLQEAFTRMMSRESRRNLMATHTNIQIGEILWNATDSEGKHWKSHVVFTPSKQYPERGLFIAAELFGDVREAQRYMALMKYDRLLSFSIGGEALKRKRICDDSGICRNVIVAMDLHETSSCDRGKNIRAKGFILKAHDEETSKAARILMKAKDGVSLLSLLTG